MFTRKSRKIINILKELTLGVDDKTCINGLKCGRKSMQELKAKYYVTSESAQRNQDARSERKKIFYKNEATFKF